MSGDDHYFYDSLGNKKAYRSETVSFQNNRRLRKVMLTGRKKLGEDYDELDELFDLYKSTYKDWKESEHKPESKSIRLRRILSLIRKVAKRRRFEVQEVRNNQKLKKIGLD